MLGIAPFTWTQREAAAAVSAEGFVRQVTEKKNLEESSSMHTSKSQTFLFGFPLNQGYCKSRCKRVTSSSCINDFCSFYNGLLQGFLSFCEKSRSVGPKLNKDFINSLEMKENISIILHNENWDNHKFTECPTVCKCTKPEPQKQQSARPSYLWGEAKPCISYLNSPSKSTNRTFTFCNINEGATITPQHGLGKFNLASCFGLLTKSKSKWTVAIMCPTKK